MVAHASTLTTSTINTAVSASKATVLEIAGDALPEIIAGVLLILLFFLGWFWFRKLFGLRGTSQHQLDETRHQVRALWQRVDPGGEMRNKKRRKVHVDWLGHKLDRPWWISGAKEVD